MKSGRGRRAERGEEARGCGGGVEKRKSERGRVSERERYEGEV